MADRSSGTLVERLISALEEPSGESALRFLDLLARETGEPAPAALLKLLTHLDVDDERARDLLRASFERRDEYRAKLGRDVGPRVALFDTVVAVERLLANPKIIDLPLFEEIEKSAITDHLTSLYNRSYFDSRLQAEIRRARRYGQHLSVLLLDLDDFKLVNDTRGHLIGDAVLRETASLIHDRVRDVDIAARYGGEEFAVILPETRRKGAFVVAERIRGEVQRHFRRRGSFDRAVRMTVSGGLACYPEDAEDPSSLLSKADKALYRAKRNGKDLIEVFFEEKRRAERIAVEARRLKAILQGGVATGHVRRSGRVKNISEGGLLVELTEPIPVGSELQVTFSLDPDHAFTFPSKVVRIEPDTTGGKRRRFEAGLRFQRRARSLQPALSRLARQRLAAG